MYATAGAWPCGRRHGRATAPGASSPGSSNRNGAAHSRPAGACSGIALEGEALKGADADMAVTEPHQHRRAGRRGFVAALQRLAGLDQREAARGRTPSASSIRWRAPRALPPWLSRPSPSGSTGVRPEPFVPKSINRRPNRALRDRKPRPSPISGLYTRTDAVVAQRQRRGQAAGRGAKAAEMGDPCGIVETSEADCARGAIVAKAQRRLGKSAAQQDRRNRRRVRGSPFPG